MQYTGIIRRIDELGRITLPVELRCTFKLAKKDGLELFVEGDNIILRKYEPACTYCGTMKGINAFKGKNICGICAVEIARMIETII